MTDGTDNVGNVLVVQHQDDAPPGLLGDWAAERGVLLTVTRPDRGEALPDPERFAAVVVLGSDEYAIRGIHEWIDRELRWLEYAVDSGPPVLGICFGAQALAVALGGGRRRAVRPEVGWIEVEGDEGWGVPPGPWLSWHHDVIEPPPFSSVIARNAFGPQAFRAGRHLGVQFHPEVTAEALAGWAARGHADLAAADVDRGRLAAQTVARAPRSARAARKLFDAFAASAHAIPDSQRALLGDLT